VGCVSWCSEQQASTRILEQEKARKTPSATFQPAAGLGDSHNKETSRMQHLSTDEGNDMLPNIRCDAPQVVEISYVINLLRILCSITIC
jgi:hypothetical protein